ncbi:hypothetical protein D917_10735, partial [Trichinella nativa]
MDISDYVTKSTETRIVDTSTAVRPVSSESNQSTSLSTVTATKSLDVRERLASVAQSKIEEQVPNWIKQLPTELLMAERQLKNLFLKSSIDKVQRTMTRHRIESKFITEGTPWND